MILSCTACWNVVFIDQFPDPGLRTSTKRDSVCVGFGVLCCDADQANLRSLKLSCMKVEILDIFFLLGACVKCLNSIG